MRGNRHPLLGYPDELHCTVYPRACGGTMPAASIFDRRDHRVYPRACGGTLAELRQQPVNSRTRSIPARAGEPCLVSPAGLLRMRRSIPARAGEPITSDRRAPSHYGSIPARAGEPATPARPGDAVKPTRSIPARAGEPPAELRPAANVADGSIPARAGEPLRRSRPTILPICTGLSPRVRGNPR